MGNTGFSLSAEELVYLVQMRKRGALLGITNPFQMLSDAEEAVAVAEAEDSLVDRGLLKLSFGGKASVDEDLTNLLDVCTEFDCYIGFDLRSETGEMATERLYKKENVWATISDADNQGFLISYIPHQQVRAKIAALPKADFSETERLDIFLQKRELKRIGRHIQSGELAQAAAILADYDFSKYSKQVLLESLEMKLPFLSLTLGEPTPRGVKIENAAVVQKGKTMAEFYQTVGDDDRTMIGLRPAREGVYPKLREVAKQWSEASL